MLKFGILLKMTCRQVFTKARTYPLIFPTIPGEGVADQKHYFNLSRPDTLPNLNSEVSKRI